MLHFTAALILLICAVLPYGKPCLPGKETDDPQGRCCVFPFVYRGVSYDRCTWINNNKLWCSLDAVYAGQWANCGKPCPPGKETDDPQGRCCVFPFVYRGVSYDRCTWINNNKLWCSLDAVYAGQWANCGKCPPGKNTDDPQGRCCVFPFSYGSYFYYSCTKTNHNKFWCSLDYRYAGQWANCDQACKDRDEAACQYWSSNCSLSSQLREICKKTCNQC
ncbi:epididymal sperm-binding protein 1-like isoform X2 [Oculina patagonica]